MKMPSNNLRAALASRAPAASAALIDRDQSLPLGEALRLAAPEAAGCTVMLFADGQLAAARALIALDGVARRIVLCPPDLSDERKAVIAGRVGAEISIGDAQPASTDQPGGQPVETDWVLLTSGTSGVPKTVRHTLATLTGAIRPSADNPADIVWSTFYDIRRYGGLQIFLRAVLGGHNLVLSNAQEPMAEFLARAGRNGVTHLTGTPSHWRSALMSPAIGDIAPRYVRLSGEIADQAVLDALNTAFPAARIIHAYASTEAGVGFEVTDGRAGFPASLVDGPQPGFDARVVDGALQIRSARTAFEYVGDGEGPLRDADGFVDTGDMVERRGGRYYFAGRRGGIINVGGAKVHPEEVEAIINRVPGVRVSLVKAKANPIVGAIVVADVVPTDGMPVADPDELKASISEACRAQLAEYKVPVIIRLVAEVPMSPTGKLKRSNV
jgi:acyl-coenzyme A synthetase/AMP-(fatty) acid ligase